MSVNAAAVFSYAGVSMREDEAGWCDTNCVRFLRERGWGYVAPLILDGRTLQNDAHLDRIRRDTRAQGTALVGWVTPRLDTPVAETCQIAAELVDRYGLDGIRYQCEAEFEYSNASMGGTPEQRYELMAHLGAEHRARMGNLPTAVYARVGLNLADAWWAKAWQFGFRCFVECYAPTESYRDPTHPGWAVIAAPGSAQPPLVGGWSYRVKLGTKFYFGRLSDDRLSVNVEGQGVFRVGSAAGPRYIEQFGDARWGGIVGFFPTSWLKPVVPTYPVSGNPKPMGSTLAGEIRTFQSLVRRYGGATKGYSVFVGPEMTADHFANISPSALAGAALLP